MIIYNLLFDLKSLQTILKAFSWMLLILLLNVP